MHGGRRGANRFLVIKPEENIPFGRPRYRWEVMWKCVCGVGGHRLELHGSGQGQVVGSCECRNEPLVSIKLTRWGPLSFPWRTLLHTVNTLLLFINHENVCVFPWLFLYIQNHITIFVMLAGFMTVLQWVQVL
jgi:hypothetical protein